jgi:hypothetical protein
VWALRCYSLSHPSPSRCSGFRMGHPDLAAPRRNMQVLPLRCAQDDRCVRDEGCATRWTLRVDWMVGNFPTLTSLGWGTRHPVREKTRKPLFVQSELPHYIERLASYYFPHQYSRAETSLDRSDNVETTCAVKVVGMGIADNAKRGRSLSADDLDTVVDERSSNTTTPHAGVNEQSI